MVVYWVDDLPSTYVNGAKSDGNAARKAFLDDRPDVLVFQANWIPAVDPSPRLPKDEKFVVVGLNVGVASPPPYPYLKSYVPVIESVGPEAAGVGKNSHLLIA